ncbi:MAG TPA: Calx-beta domain-containing protein [Chthoniobacterales bacterium]|nr:Calx-beta domain-containing protein [Chthoniobacterales bacterium]
MKKSGILAMLLAFASVAHAQTLEFTNSVYTVNEGAGTVTLTVLKSGTAASTITVRYSTSDGFSATAPGDYIATTGQLTFAPNETTKQFSVPIVENAIYEGSETFNVILSDPTGGAAVRDPWSAQVSIQDNDPAPEVRFGSASSSASEAAGSATLTITKTGATEVPATVYYKTRDGTATAPSDYTFTGDDLTASVTFQPEETSVDIQIPIANDVYREPDETFEVYFTLTLGGSPVTPATAIVTITDDDAQGPLPPAQAVNISTRARVGTGDGVTIGGFIINGNAHKPVVLRGLGPSLAGAGVPSNEVLLDPVLKLHGPTGSLMAQDDNWRDDPLTRALIEGTPYQPMDERESVIVALLAPAAYTAVVTGPGQTGGIGLMEIYDSNQAADSELANISTRGFVQTENGVMIGGFILGRNPGNIRVAVRGIGPSLSQFGVGNVLADPVLELHDGNGTILASNDNWQENAASAAELAANGLALQHPNESGIFESLPPGAYTAILSGRNAGSGIGSVEIYNLH